MSAMAAMAQARANVAARELRLTWEALAYAGLLVVGAGMRFWDLGSRALHHDESLHGYYAYRLFEGGGYQHDPLLHGPFQFFGMAATFFLAGGASDYTVRILPAVFGALLILLPYFFRRRLGTAGALFAAALIAFSPTLLYFSRFARNDIYIAVFTLTLVICLWRWLDERKPLYLYLAAGALAFSFATKENTYITAALLLVFLDFWLAADFARQAREAGAGRALTAAKYALLFAPFAWALAALWPLLGRWKDRFGLRELHPAGDFLVVIGTLTLPQLSAVAQVPLEALGVELDTLGREQAVGIPTVLTLLAGSAAVGLLWGRRLWLGVAVAFYIPYVLLFTSFAAYPDGFGSGMWDSLDYWLDQHDFRRGDQPDFYYVMLLPAYEYLALAFAGPALLWHTLRGGPRSWLLTAIATLALLAFFGADSFDPTIGKYLPPVAMPLAAVSLYFAVTGTPFERFLVFWAASSIVAYSWVGEKMPWLSVHTTLAVLLLAAYTLGQLWERLPTPRGLLRYVPWGMPLAAVLAGAAAMAFAAFGPLDGLGRVALVGVAFAPLLAVALPLGRKRLALAVAAAVFGALAMFSVRTAVVASFEHGDVPRELLVYTQTSPDVPDVMDRIDEIARTSGRGTGLTVVVDNAYTWPWPWYLRGYDVRYADIDDAFEPPENAVLLVAQEHTPALEPFLDRYQAPASYRLRWWFPEVYRDIGRDNLWLAARDFGESLGHESTWENWWRFFRDRDPGAEPGSVAGVVYFPLAYDPSAGPDIEGRFAIGRSAAGGLRDPAGVAVDAAGNVYVVDAALGQLLKFAPDGRVLATTGAPGAAEGEFNQPGDIALDGEGNVYVLDTWNHRVQKFDANLAFLGTWGTPTLDLVNPGPGQMWGPRSITVDASGIVWIADTGTARLRRFSAEGEPLGAAGSRGRADGQFREPVGVAVDPTTGDVLVADAGNARVQRFDSEMNFLVAYSLEEWADLDPVNKPDLAALPDGRFLATDPAHGRILLIGSDGAVVASLSFVGGERLAYPRGIAFDADSNFVFVSEGLAGRVTRFPLSDFAFR